MLTWPLFAYLVSGRTDATVVRPDRMRGRSQEWSRVICAVAADPDATHPKPETLTLYLLCCVGGPTSTNCHPDWRLKPWAREALTTRRRARAPNPGSNRVNVL